MIWDFLGALDDARYITVREGQPASGPRGGLKMVEGVVKQAAKHLMNRDMYRYIWHHPK